MSRGFLVAFAAVIMCACAYEDPEIDPAETAHDEDSATEVIGELGHPLHMRCVTSEKPVRFVIWKRGNRTNMWLHNNSVYGMTGNAFLIKSLAIETLGQYTCQAYSSDGFEAPRVFNVRAYRPDGLISGDDWLVPRDAVTITPDTTEALGESTTERPEVAASEGGIATLRCQFDSMKFHRDPSTKIKWKFGEREIDDTAGRYRVTSDGALQIVSLYRNDTGVYTCEPDDALGEASHDIHLIVNDPVSIPAGIAGEDNATITAELNQPLHVRCLPYGYPNPSVIWTRDDEVSIVLYNNSIYEVTETVLVIRSLILDALGPYTCRAYNEAGRMASWEVVVQAYKPEGLLIENEWLVPRENMAPTPIPITQPSITTDIWPFTDKVYNCDKYLVNCSRLRCEYGIQRTRQHDGCEQCSCVQVESDCEPLQQECTQLKCNYGIERVTGSDGCERCKCKEHPCERKSCAAGERCVVLSYKDGIHPEPQFTTECRTIVKAGACPMDETATDEDTCHRECADDAHCRGEAKCCRRGCSDVCLAPVEQTSPRPLLTTTIASNPDQLLPPDCTPYQQECETLDCPYGIDRFTQDECQRCVCSEDPCIRAICQPTERCEAAALWNHASQEPEYSAKCVYENTEVHQCDEYVANCSRLRCEYGIQRTRQHDGCEQCSCVQVESDCEPLQQECTQLQCRYGIQRVTEPDGCERCKCKEDPCERKSCAVGERCVVQQYVLPGFRPERQFKTECRTIVKAGACPMNETTTDEDKCRRECADDAHCRGEAKCCRRGCSDVCLAPVEQTSPRPLLTTTITSNPDQLLPPDCTPYQQECEALDCPYGVDRFMQDECQKCVCSEDPCIRANCQPTERCEAAALWNPASQEPEYFAKCVYENTEVHQCDEYVANCSRLRCEYGIQRTRQHDGCEQCSCVQVESDCEPLQQECTQLQCRYGIERVTEPDGCERCKCKEHPCKWKFCAVGERCVVQQYVLPGFQPERQFTTECRTIVKADACPMDETTTNEVTCRMVCRDDADCRGEDKCCRRGCSDVCLAPVQQTSPRPNPVKKPVRIHGDQNAAVIGELGQPLPVHCLADGNPPPAVFWYFGYEENMVPYYNVDYLARGSVLLFRNLTIKNLGRYTCHAYNGEDKAATWSVIVRAYMPEGLFIDNEFVVPRTQTFTAAETTTKTLSTKKPFSLLLILPVTAHASTPFSILNIGTDLHMICEIDGSPVPEVNWTKDGANIPPDPRITVTAGGTGVSRLTVTRVTVADSGLYACHASNPYSSQSDTVRINVQKLIAPAECTDDEPLAFCALVVRSKLCRAKNYPKSCCKSCVEAGQLDAPDLYQGLT